MKKRKPSNPKNNQIGIPAYQHKPIRRKSGANSLSGVEYDLIEVEMEGLGGKYKTVILG